MKKITFPRNIYLARIIPLLDTPYIKVITGMRRVGKTALLEQLHEHLLSVKKIPAKNICVINKEDLSFDHIEDYQHLHTHVESFFHTVSGKKYLLIDEIQDITEWEKALRHYVKNTDYDIIITGSNAHILSGELATYLSGRSIEIPVYPLTFAEFLTFCPDQNFDNYCQVGGLPGVVLLQNPEAQKQALEGILHTVLFRDVIGRYQVRQGALLNDLISFIATNIGSPTSTSSIAKYLKKERITLSFETVREYLRYFTEAHLFSSVSWHDIIGKRHLDLDKKYYFTDIGLKNMLTGYRDVYRGHLLENIVYSELLARGYTVSIGRVGSWEVDFIAERSGEKLYIQVAYLLASEETIEREFRPLLSIDNNYPKLVLSMDTQWGSDYEGVQRMYLPDWLLVK